MTNRDIETLAVNAVRDSIAVCDYLESYLNDNDKTPSWDGEIFIYGNSSKKKECFRGKISVQIKGKMQKDLSRTEITYPVSTIDLRNFESVGGTMYFVVYISTADKCMRKIYYNDLNPVKLHHYLKNAKGKSVNLKFKEFPSDSNSKANICLNFFEECVKQSSFKENILTLDDLPSKNVTSIKMTYSGYGEAPSDLFQPLLENNIGLYVQLNNEGVLYPVDTTDVALQIQQKRNCSVKVGGQEYYSEILLERSASDLVIKIGESIIIKYLLSNGKSEFKYKLTDSLRNAVVDMAFMNALISTRELEVGAAKYGVPDEVCAKYNYEWAVCRLRQLKDYVKALDTLHVSKDLDLSKLSRADERNLNTLITAFVKKRSVKDLNPNLPPICTMSIGDNIRVLLGVDRNKTDATLFRVYDVFNCSAPIQYKSPVLDGRMLWASPYSVLSADDYLVIDNIHYETLSATYKRLKENNPIVPEIANRDMLIMLLAYDKSNNAKLLDVAEDLARFILNDGTYESLPHAYRLLNLLQVIKRKRELNTDEMDQLYDILEDGSSFLKVGAALLLDDMRGAKRLFAKLSDQEQKTFRAYPIYHFWKE